MKPNVFILNCCLLGKSEIAFWNALIAEHSNDYCFKFFTSSPCKEIKADECIDLSYRTCVFDEVPGRENNRFDEIINRVAIKDHIWEEYRPGESEKLAASWIIFWALAIKLYRPERVIVWNGHHVAEAALAEVCRVYSTDLMFAERGPLGGTFALDRAGLNFNSTFVARYAELHAANSQSAVRQYADLYFSKGESNWNQPDRVAGREEFLANLAIPEHKQLLFFPSQVDRDTNSKLHSPHYGNVFQAFKAVVEWCNLNQDSVFLLAKRHPMQEDAELFDELQIESGRWIENIHIFDCIQFCDAVVSINSSAATEAALLGKPVLLLGQCILQPWEHAIKLEKPEDLAARLEELIDTSKNATQVPNVEYFSKLLFGYLFATDKKLIDIGLNPPKLPAKTIVRRSEINDPILRNRLDSIRFLVPQHSEQQSGARGVTLEVESRNRELANQARILGDELDHLNNKPWVRLLRKLRLIR